MDGGGEVAELEVRTRLTLSFVIPAHNEEALIGGTVRAIRVAAARYSHEIIVVNDGSTDRTSDAASAESARVVTVNARQIAAVRNAGAAAATGDLLLFVDADTLVTREVVDEVVQAVGAGAIGGGSLVRLDRPVGRSVRAWVTAFSWLSRTFRIAGGCFLFSSKEGFRAIGGFDETYFVAEDIAFCRALARRGRVVIVRSPVTTSARKLTTHSAGEIVRTILYLSVRPGAIKRRAALGFWYGPRRKDE
jgi:glycosyltransferase involved in cell wall biosynthesis